MSEIFLMARLVVEPRTFYIRLYTIILALTNFTFGTEYSSANVKDVDDAHDEH
jgi:hypothetical protein